MSSPHCIFTILCIHYTATSPQLVFTTLSLHHTVSSPYCIFTTLCLHYTATSPQPVFITLCLHHIVSSPHCIFTTLHLHQTVSLLHCDFTLTCLHHTVYSPHCVFTTLLWSIFNCRKLKLTELQGTTLKWQNGILSQCGFRRVCLRDQIEKQSSLKQGKRTYFLMGQFNTLLLINHDTWLFWKRDCFFLPSPLWDRALKHTKWRQTEDNIKLTLAVQIPS